MDALGAYGSESEREAGDRDAGDDDAFVGPARPPPRVVGKPPVDDEEDARRDDVAFLESMCGDEERARGGVDERARAGTERPGAASRRASVRGGGDGGDAGDADARE